MFYWTDAKPSVTFFNGEPFPQGYIFEQGQVELSPVNTRDPAEIERAVAAFAREPNGGLIVAVSSSATVHRDLIIALAAKHRLPAIYPYRYYVVSGGLMSYGADPVDLYRQAASYVDR